MQKYDFLEDKELQAFVCSVRRRALADCNFAVSTRPQQIKLIVQIENALVDKENRLRVLRALTGLPKLKSQTELTLYYHSVLIDETINNQADEILGRIESIVMEYPFGHAHKLFPWDRPISEDEKCLQTTMMV